MREVGLVAEVNERWAEKNQTWLNSWERLQSLANLWFLKKKEKKREEEKVWKKDERDWRKRWDSDWESLGRPNKQGPKHRSYPFFCEMSVLRQQRRDLESSHSSNNGFLLTSVGSGDKNTSVGGLLFIFTSSLPSLLPVLSRLKRLLQEQNHRVMAMTTEHCLWTWREWEEVDVEEWRATVRIKSAFCVLSNANL